MLIRATGRLIPRFHYTKPELTEQELNGFCNVNYDTNFALVVEMFRHGHIEVVGVGCYSCLPCCDTAEVPFVIEDTEQGNGIGTQLLKLLAKIPFLTTMLRTGDGEVKKRSSSLPWFLCHSEEPR